MEQHGGRIHAKSEQGEYAEFVLVFPAKRIGTQPEQMNH